MQKDRLIAFYKANRLDIVVIASLFILLPLFLWNIGNYSLVDFDEAWYAEIARNIIKFGNPYLLQFNGQPYIDHPPVGFILMAISFFVLGISDFSSRLPSALLGFGAVVLTYLLGKELFNRLVGYSASLVLASSVWFALRARSGNLDAPLVFFIVLTFYLAVKAGKTPKFIFPAVISLGLLLLTKSVIGLAVVPPIIAYLILRRTKFPFFYLLSSGIILILILSVWYLPNLVAYGPPFLQHTLSIGTRSAYQTRPDLINIMNLIPTQYLHFGMLKWFYPGILALIGSLFFLRKSSSLFVLYLTLLIFFYGFYTNSKTEIWHIIPVYPFWALMIAFFVDRIGNIFVIKFPKRHFQKLLPIAIIALFWLFAGKQIYGFRHDINLEGRSTSALAYTSAGAINRPESLYLDSDDFFPAAVFYSQHNISLVKSIPSPQNTLKGIIDSKSDTFLLLTEDWKLKVDNVNPDKYVVLREKDGKVLIEVN